MTAVRDDRRQPASGVAFVPERNELVVGQRAAVVADLRDPALVMQTYFSLVVEQRAVPPTERSHVRDRDLAALAGIVALPTAVVESYVEAELERFLESLGGDQGMDDEIEILTSPAETELVAGEPRRTVTTRRKLVLGGAIAALLAVTLAIAAGAANGGAADPTPAPQAERTSTDDLPTPPTAPPSGIEAPVGPSTDLDIGDSVRIERQPDGSSVVITESAPAPATDDTDIGTAVVIERQP